MTKRRLILASLLILGSVWGWLVSADLRAARRHASIAVTAGEEAADLVAAGDLAAGRRALERAVAELDIAADRLDDVSLWPLRIVPFAGTEIRAADAGVAAARETSLASLEVLGFLDDERPPLLEGTSIDPAVFGSLRASLQRALAHSEEALAVLDAAPGSRVGSTQRRLDRVTEVNDGLLAGLGAAVRVTDRLGLAIDGGEPYRVLLLFENGAELRATAGLMGFVAVLAVDDAELRLEQAQEVHALAERDAGGEYLTVGAPQDYVGRYGEFLANTTLWLNVNLSPHFPSVADVASRLYEEVTGVRPDAVLRIDLVGAGYVLESFATIFVEGEPLDPTQLATSFLLDSYRRFPDADAHSAYLADVFDEIFDQVLGGGGGDSGALLSAFRRTLAEGRLAVFTGDEEIDAALEQAGADGALAPGDPGELEVSVQNFGANKVDLFTRTAVEVSIDSEGCTLRGRLSVALTNGLPDGVDFLPAGEGGRNGVWWTSFFLPREATVLELEVDGEPALGSLDTEQGRPVAAILVEAEPGDTVVAAVEWSEQLVEPGYRLRLDPQPHLIPATLSVNGDEPGRFTEDRSFEIDTECEPSG